MGQRVPQADQNRKRLHFNSCITPDLKSLALGIQTLVTRTLGGIPAPVYFGALIDSTCLKWSIKKCGGRGACRIYDSNMYRIVFLGLITCLSGTSYFFMIAVIVLLKRQFWKADRETELQQPRAAKESGIMVQLDIQEKSCAGNTSPKPSSDKTDSTGVEKDLEG